MPTIYNTALSGKPPGGSGGVGYSIRSNAFASVGFAGGGPDSPTLATNAGNGRPAPTLQSVKVTLEGTAGSLRRGQFTVIVYEASQLESVIGSGGVGGIGNTVTISIGRSGPGAGGGSGWQFAVYKNSFSNDKQGRYTITVDCVGKGMDAFRKDGIGLPKKAQGKTFKKFAEILGFPWLEEISVTNIVDYMMWEALDGGIGGFPITLSIESGESNGDWVHMITPTGVKPRNDENSVGPSNRLVWFRLGWILDLIKDGMAPGGPTLKYNKDEGMDVESEIVPGVHCISGDPLSVLIRNDPYSDYPVDGETQSLADLIFGALSQPSGIFTSKASGMLPLAGDCANVYVSYHALKGIIKDATTGAKSSDQADLERANGSGTSLNLDSFLSSLFSIIKEATGGWIDLDYIEDPKAWESGSEKADIIIYNRKSKNSAAGPAILDDVSGEGGVRSAAINGSVPTGWQQEAFSKQGTINDEPAKTAIAILDLAKAKNDLAKAGFDVSQAAGLQAALRKAQDDMDINQIKNKTDRPYPIGLSITCNGFLNPGFGNSFGIQSLDATRWRNNTAFTITRVIHEVKGNDWTTSLESVARLVP